MNSGHQPISGYYIGHSGGPLKWNSNLHTGYKGPEGYSGYSSYSGYNIGIDPFRRRRRPNLWRRFIKLFI